MPILISTKEIQPGHRLAEAFEHNGRLMLPAGRELTASEIGVLHRQYQGCELRVTDPVLDALADFEDDGYERQVAGNVQKNVQNGVDSLLKLIIERKYKSLPSGELAKIRTLVQQQLTYLANQPISAVLLSDRSGGRRQMSFHTANVFLLSMVLALSLRDYVASERLRHTSSQSINRSTARDLLPLGLGVVCMDLGMAPLEYLHDKDDPLTEDECRQIREHPNAAVDMLPGSFSPTARMVVRTHHENFDGTGYPQGLTSDQLHVFTRIVRIADAFIAATFHQDADQARSQAAALWEMTFGPYNRFFDPLLMKVFFSLVQPFPIGAKVRLCDDRYAIVVRYNRNNPFEPRVIVAYDEAGDRLPEGQIQGPFDIGVDNGLSITSFRGEDLSFISHELTEKLIEPLSRKQFQSAFEAVYP